MLYKYEMISRLRYTVSPVSRCQHEVSGLFTVVLGPLSFGTSWVI